TASSAGLGRAAGLDSRAMSATVSMTSGSSLASEKRHYRLLHLSSILICNSRCAPVSARYHDPGHALSPAEAEADPQAAPRHGRARRDRGLDSALRGL